MPRNKKATKPKLNKEERESLEYVKDKAQLAAGLITSGAALTADIMSACYKSIGKFLKEHQ